MLSFSLIKQKEVDTRGQYLLMNVEYNEESTSQELMNTARAMNQRYKTVEEDIEKEMGLAWDDVFGAELNPRAVRQSREEEIDYVRKMKLYNKVPISECYKETGRKPVSVRWVDTDKGTATEPNLRSRLVAQEF